MRSSIIALVGLAALVAAVPNPTFCSEDNALRAFQHTPTAACAYCATSTAGPYPTFLAVATYPPTRLASACSCFAANPTDRGSPACQPTNYHFVASETTYGTHGDMIFTIDRNQPCGYQPGPQGYIITSICGYWSGTCSEFNPVKYTQANGYAQATGDSCYYPDHVPAIDGAGVNFYGQGGLQTLYYDNTNSIFKLGGGGGQGFGNYPVDSFTAIPCNTCYTCPGSPACPATP